MTPRRGRAKAAAAPDADPGAAERRALLDEYFALEPRRHEPGAIARRDELRAAYEAWLPRVRIARCPFTDEVVRTSFDPEGLDGLWWRYELPVRGYDERPATFFALTGAVALGRGGPEPAPFDRMPGPTGPYVVPRMLLHEDVKAVVKALPVGSHTAYAITYFARPVPPMLQRFNEWGASFYTYETDTDPDLWDESDEASEVLDDDLARWIDSGDLLWVAPGDDSCALRSTSADCPYVGLAGERAFTLMEAGPAPRSRTRPSTARRSAAP